MRRWVILMGTSPLWFSSAAQPQIPTEQLLAAGDGSGSVLPDDQTEARLNHELRVSGITSHVDGGIATLEGMVTSEADKARAEQLARRAQGVTQVHSRIVVSDDVSSTVHAGAPLTPALDASVLAQIGADARLAERDIDVRVSSRNAVTLTGEVQSESEKVLAGRIAADTHPATEVRNRLVVRPE